MLRSTLIAIAPLLCAAHYGIISPPMWTDPKAKYIHSNAWRVQGCGDTPKVPKGVKGCVAGCLPQWYTNGTFIPEDQQPTIPADSILRTWSAKCPFGRDGSQIPKKQNCREHPWAAPGAAPIHSPCGHDGGNPDGCPKGYPGKDGCASGGYGHGPDARAWYQSRPRFVTEWQAGAEVLITWGIAANHGGGYSFRLCPKPTNFTDLTEECFQKGSLEFVGNTSIAIYDIDKLNERTEFPAYGISLPTGHWRQNPMPACGGFFGGAILGICPKPYQFPPRVNRTGTNQSMAGFGGLPNPFSLLKDPLAKWAVEDKVKVPVDLAPGEYILSYRMDCEQTPQVWNMCGDIKVASPTVSV